MPNPHSPQDSGTRPRGRPRLVIAEDELLDAVEQLLRDGGVESVSIERAAQELGVSRATLYRSISTKEQLLSRLFKRIFDELTAAAQDASREDGRSAGERLNALIRAHVAAAIRSREYMFVLFGRDWLEEEIYTEFRLFMRDFESIWRAVVQDAIDDGCLAATDARAATRLILGMLIWISRWYRPGHDDADHIAAQAILLLGGRP